MRNHLILIFCLILSVSVLAQERETFQDDSIYKANKIKLRKWYSGENKKLGIITYYDKEGRMIKYLVEMNLGATTRTTHYEYDNNGKLVGMVDSTKNGVPDKNELERLKKMGLNPNLILGGVTNKPPLEISKYELTYNQNELIKITKFNPDGTLDFVDSFQKDGKVQTRDWYRGGKVYRANTTEYLSQNHKEKFWGWENSNNKKNTWNYTFKYVQENGKVTSYTRFDNGNPKETVKYSYDRNGLLTKTEGYSVEQFEYEYY